MWWIWGGVGGEFGLTIGGMNSQSVHHGCQVLRRTSCSALPVLALSHFHIVPHTLQAVKYLKESNEMDALVALMHLSSLLMYLPALAEGTAEPELIASSLQVWNGSVVVKL